MSLSGRAGGTAGAQFPACAVCPVKQMDLQVKEGTSPAGAGSRGQSGHTCGAPGLALPAAAGVASLTWPLVSF